MNNTAEKMMSYEDAVQYIEEVPKFTKKNKPENTLELIRRIGHPERKMKVIHVAGTNGKGSVCAFLSSILTNAGKKTGLFTSPHLVEITERFQINQKKVDHEAFVQAFVRVKSEVDAMMKEGYAHPAYFELLFATGLLIFEAAEVEYLVLETGLGGRLDATNLVEHPVACVLTTISLDHMEYLGDTVAKIAGEKAGIIKEGVPVIYDGRNPESDEVIRAYAEKMHAPAYRYDAGMSHITGKTDKSIDFILNCSYDEGNSDASEAQSTHEMIQKNCENAAKTGETAGCCGTKWYDNQKVTVPYLAEYQLVNSSLALIALRVIDPEMTISAEQAVKGIRDTRWQGRMETVLPGVVFDGAHNADGIREFIRTVQSVQENREISLLFSAVVEKEYEKMIQTICESCRPVSVVVTQIDGARVVPADTLAEVFRKYTKAPVIAKTDVEEAFDTALENKGDSMLFCAGSLYLVGELKAILLKREGQVQK